MLRTDAVAAQMIGVEDTSAQATSEGGSDHVATQVILDSQDSESTIEGST